MNSLFKTLALSAAASVGVIVSVPSSAAPAVDVTTTSLLADVQPTTIENGEDSWQHRRYRNGRRYYSGSRAYRGRYYCRRGRGTTGMIVGGAAGALLGREVDRGRNRATGTILGAAGGALLGREVARNRRCR